MKYFVLVLIAVILASCGGGGAASIPTPTPAPTPTPTPTPTPVEFTLSHTALGYIVWDGSSQKTGQFIAGWVEPSESDVYMFADASLMPQLESVEIYTGDTDFSLSFEGTPNEIFALTSEWSDLISVGTYTGSVVFSACKDPGCLEHYTGSPRSVDIIYTLLPLENPDVGCGHVSGYVFDECIDANWAGAQGWEMLSDGTNTNYSYLDGDTSNLINWSVLDTNEPGYDNVLDIQFNDSSSANGSFRFLVADSYSTGDHTVDMSEFGTGALEFDYRVLNWGSNTSGLTVTVECVWPCTTGEIALGQPALNEWNHEVLNVSDLIALGLDLTQVSVGLMIAPTWGDMSGVEFQLDNVRWKAGD
ncbi:MAG: hypothetical protein ACI93R_003200 [Flavobacteriales bacterium]|jgi:hypothetical protein